MTLCSRKGQVAVRSWFVSEDWFAVWLGVIVVALAVPAAAGYDLLGLDRRAQVWLEAGKAVRAGLEGLSPVCRDRSACCSTYLFLLCAGRGRGRGAAVRPSQVLAGFHGHLLDQRGLLAAGSLRVHRPDARQAGGDGHFLVAGPDRRGGLPGRLAGGAGRGQLSCPGWRPGSRWRLGRNGSSRRRS